MARGRDDGIGGATHTQAQVLEYWAFCDRIVDDAVDAYFVDGTVPDKAGIRCE